MRKRKTTVNLDPDLVKAARIFAASQSTETSFLSLGEVIEQALIKFLPEQKVEAIS